MKQDMQSYSSFYKNKHSFKLHKCLVVSNDHPVTRTFDAFPEAGTKEHPDGEDPRPMESSTTTALVGLSQLVGVCKW